MVADVTIDFVGSSTQAECRKWGSLLVGKGKALVTLDNIYVGNAKPPYLYRDGSDQSWPNGIDIATVARIQETHHQIVVNTSSLRVTVGGVPSVGGGPTNGNEIQEGNDDASRGVQQATSQKKTPVQVDCNVFQENQYDEDIEDLDLLSYASLDDGYDSPGNKDDGIAVRSRGKEDIWHMFHALPLPRKCVIKVPVLQLMVSSAFCLLTKTSKPQNLL